jgi:hypothetical protein
MRGTAPARWHWGLAVLALALPGALVGCGSRKSDAETDAGPAPTPPALPRFWLQHVQLEPLVAGGAAPAEVHHPARVELDADGVVRSLPGETPTFEGRLPESLLKTPADARGLRLYAQRLVELHHGTPDGMVIGRLYPGALASVAPAGESSWLVAVPYYGVLAFVPKDAMGDTKPPAPAETLDGDTHFDFTRDVPFSTEPLDGPPAGWVDLLCGGFRVDDRIRQYYRGVEIDLSYDYARRFGGLGFTHQYPERGPNPCSPRYLYRGPHGMFMLDERSWRHRIYVEAIPAGYMMRETPTTEPIRDALEKQRAVYWLSGASGKLECEQWRFVRKWVGISGIAAPALVRAGGAEPMWYPIDVPRFSHYGVVDESPSLGLWGPKSHRVGYTCSEDFQVLKLTEDRMYMGLPGRLEGWPATDDIAFPPDQVEQWFLTREACESVRRVAPQTPHQLAPGLRRPCHRNFQRGNTGYW